MYMNIQICVCTYIPAANSVTCGATPPTAIVCRDSHVKNAMRSGTPPSTARLATPVMHTFTFQISMYIFDVCGKRC